MSRPDAVLIFAAGFGTRMGDLTRDLPKPMLEVAGRRLIDRAIDLADQAGVGRRVANVHYRAECLAPVLEARGVAVSTEAPRILETGGGLRAALPLLGPGPVLTFNADAVWTGPNPLAALAAAWRADAMDALLMLVPRDRATAHDGPGDFEIDAAGRITRRRGARATHVFTGAQVIAPKLLEHIDEEVFSLNRAWDAMIAAGRLYGLLHPGGWADVGTPAGIAAAARLLEDAGDA